MSKKRTIIREPSALLTTIEIEDLFGRYSYRLKIPLSPVTDFAPLTMIYGDNGTGKTTILKLIYHLLSAADKRGHRTFLARIPFSRFTVIFSNRIEISAIRKNYPLPGSYMLKFKKPYHSAIAGEVEIDKDNSVMDLAPDAEQIVEEIKKLGLSIYFLGDDRKLQSDEFPKEGEEDYLVEFFRKEQVFRKEERIPRPPEFTARDAELIQSIERTATWIRRRLIQESRRGEADAQQIYANIVKKINKRGVSRIQNYENQKGGLIQSLKELDSRSTFFTEFGLIPRINSSPFIRALVGASKERFPSVAQVVSSFIDVQKARLDAFDQLNQLLYRFVKQINTFFIDKKIILDLKNPEVLSILTNTGLPLRSENLSSGEKQLLLLFCNVLGSSESASLFIVDEPEISLNVKWQRYLIDALLDLTAGSQCQFLLATHSIELVAKHKRQVIKLQPY